MPVDFPRVRESLLWWPQSNDFGHPCYRKFSAVRGWRADTVEAVDAVCDGVVTEQRVLEDTGGTV
jgi:hypothetical protein